MRRRWVFATIVGWQCAEACFVPSFDVDPPVTGAGTNSGGSASGGVASGGTSGGKGGTQNPTSGTKGELTGAGEPGSGGMPGASGEPTTGGAGGAGGETTTNAGPHRVGFSEFHDSAAGGDDASASLADATFVKPAGTAPGDFMLVFFGCDHQLSGLSAGALTGKGWTLHDQHANYGQDGQATYLIYRIADGTEPASIVFAGINNSGGGNGVQGLLSVYRGVNAKTPVNAYKTNLVATGSDVFSHVDTATPAITTTVDDCLLIAGLSPDTAIDAPTVSVWPTGFNLNRVSVNNPVNPNPNGWANIYSAERAMPKAGSVAASAFGWDMTYGGTLYYGALTFVLALAPE